MEKKKLRGAGGCGKLLDMKLRVPTGARRARTSVNYVFTMPFLCLAMQQCLLQESLFHRSGAVAVASPAPGKRSTRAARLLLRKKLMFVLLRNEMLLFFEHTKQNKKQNGAWACTHGPTAGTSTLPVAAGTSTSRLPDAGGCLSCCLLLMASLSLSPSAQAQPIRQ